MNAKSRRGGVLVPLVAAGAAIVGGIVSYSISVASATPALPEVAVEVRPAGTPDNCYSAPNLDRYLQSKQALPKLLSFSSTASGALPAGDPCGGGGDGGSSCLSTFGFDPEDYWVASPTTDTESSSANIFVATYGSLVALSDSDIATTTGCSVSYEWYFPAPDEPFSTILGYWQSDWPSIAATGATTTSLNISGLSTNPTPGYPEFLYTAYELYFGTVCGDYLVLRVSDGVNSFDISAPPCNTYQTATTAYSTGFGYKFEYQDPWSRPMTDDQSPDRLSTGLVQRNIAYYNVKPNSTMKITFKESGSYTLRTGLDPNVNCAGLSVDTTIFNAALKAAASTWEDPSPASERIYCLDEVTPP